MGKMTYTQYDYSNIYKNKKSKRYYLFSHIDHFRHQKIRVVKNYNRTLKAMAQMQQKREESALKSINFKGTSEEFGKVFLNMQKNNEIFTNVLVDDIFKKEYPSISGHRGSYDVEKAKSLLNKILDGLESMYEDNFIDPDKAVKNKNGVSSVNLKAFVEQMRKSSDKKINTLAKSNIQKEIHDYLTTSKLRGAVGEAAVAQVLELMRGQFKIDDENIKTIITGNAGITTGTRKQTKGDVVLGDLTIQSKNYHIYNSTKDKSFSIHNGSIKSIGEYLDNYGQIRGEDVDNFVHAYNNISYFSSIGGLNSEEGKETPSITSFPEYDNIVNTLKGTAAIWFGTSIGLKKTGSILKADNADLIKTLTNVDFFVVGGNYVVPMSKLLMKISDDDGKIKISRSGKMNTIGPEKFYAEKMKRVYEDKIKNPYGGTLLTYGTQIGKQHSYQKVIIKLKIQAEELGR